jgi:predicted PurR-regulated permease PerM
MGIMESEVTDRENSKEREEIPKIQPMQKPVSVTALSVLGLFILGLFYTFYFAREFFLPVILALILSLLLRPVVRGLKRLRIPQAIGAVVVLVGLLAVFAVGALLVSGPATSWIERAPESLQRVEGKLRGMMNSAQPITKAAETVENIAESRTETPQVEIKKPGLLNNVWNQTKGVFVLLVEVFVLLYFFLAAGDIVALKIVQVLPRLRDKKKAVEIMRETEHGISRYLVSITLVNLFEGTAIGLGLALLGMPNPLLWGVLAFFANYIPYIGALVAGSIVTLVAFVSFDSASKALIAPLIYFGVNFADNFIAPYVMGRRLVLNPLVVFLAVMFWGWMWGIIGVLLAVPVTMTLKIVCEHSPLLAPYAELLTAPRAEQPESDGASKADLGKDAIVYKGNA